MRKRTVLALTGLVASGILAVGCDSDSNSGGGGGGKLTVESWAAQQTTGFCSYLARCGEEVGLHLASSSSCATLIAPEFLESDEAAKVAKGTMQFNADKAATCLASVQSAACSLLASEDGPPGCNEVFTGTVANGAACADSDECANGYCDFDQTKNCAVCKPFAAVGENCAFGQGCGKGATCSQGKCVAKGSVVAGQPCEDSDACTAGTFCKWGRSGGVCTTKAAKDGACEETDECAAGLVCADKSADDSDRTCQSPKAEGATCFEPGRPFEGASECAQGVCGLISNAEPPKCLPWKKMGEACESHWQCGLVDAWCSAGKCAALPSAGAACADLGFTKFCGFGLGCDNNGKCAQPPATGPCLDGDCADGAQCVCMDDQCETEECKPYGKAGDACGSNGQASCGEGLQCDFQSNKCTAPAACQ